jgi:hypothetical protein
MLFYKKRARYARETLDARCKINHHGRQVRPLPIVLQIASAMRESVFHFFK